MGKALIKLLRDPGGATALEYALIMALIFVAIIGGVRSFGVSTASLWEFSGNAMSSAVR